MRIQSLVELSRQPSYLEEKARLEADARLSNEAVALAASVRVTVEARPHGAYWTYTGINKPAGREIVIQYKFGLWTHSEAPLHDAAGLGGTSAPMEYMAAGFPAGGLVAKTGGGVLWGDRGDHGTIYIGNHGRVPENWSGLLYLTINDAEQHFGVHNRGNVTVDMAIL